MKNKKEVKPFFKAPRYILRKYNIIYLFNKYKFNSFAEIGFGAGELACTLAEGGAKGVGVDFSDLSVETANNIMKQRNINDKDIVFKKGGVKDLYGKKFDVTIFCEVLEHIEDDSKFLKEVHKIDSDYILLSVPSRQKWFDEFDRRVGHFRRYEKEQFKSLLEDEGFRVFEFYSYGYPFINLTRLIRKVLAKKVKDNQDDTENTKESGVNPIKTKLNINKDIEPLMKPFYFVSKPFNRFNLSEGYLVLCKKV